ncbi:MAG: exsH, partial [Devosia sp.]|nr:exsH [Devosia sp.]
MALIKNALGVLLSEGASNKSNLYSSSTTLSLTGTAGNEALWGGGNGVAMSGGGGDDTYYVKGPKDKVVEGAGEGIDTVVTWMNYTLGANIENLTLSGEGLVGTGNSANNILRGGAGKQTLDGGAGDDVLFGGAGADIFVIAKGNGSDLIGD